MIKNLFILAFIFYIKMEGRDTITHLNSLGIDQIKLGDSLPKNENIHKLCMYPEKDRLVFNPTNYRYFYIRDHFYKLNNLGCDIKNLFFAVDSNNVICYIFISLQGNLKPINKILDSCFNKGGYTSTSALSGQEAKRNVIWGKGTDKAVMLVTNFIESDSSQQRMNIAFSIKQDSQNDKLGPFIYVLDN
jgi:hypothetical protein